MSGGRPPDKLRNQADALRITKPAMRQIGLRWHSMKPLALLCMLNEIWRKERVNLPDKQSEMRERMTEQNYLPIPRKKTLIARKRYAPRSNGPKPIRKRVISVGLAPEMGFRKLTLECGHFVLSNSELAPHSAECRTCGLRGENQR